MAELEEWLEALRVDGIAESRKSDLLEAANKGRRILV